MNKRRPKYLLWSGLVAALAAIIIDGFLEGRGLGVMICCAFIAVVVIVSAIVEQVNKPAPEAPIKPSGQPIFAHVPGPGEPGYDPNYDPDDDKYWRRYYRDDD